MALVDAILEIADDMEKEHLDASTTAIAATLKPVLHSYVKQLRRAVKAAEGAPVDRVLPINPWATVPPEAQHRHFIDLEREKIRGSKGLTNFEEMQNRQAQVVDGPMADLIAVDVPPDITPGKMITVAGSEVYRYDTDGFLHHCPDESAKLQKSAEKTQSIILPGETT